MPRPLHAPSFSFAGLAGSILPKGSRSILPNGRHICVLSCAESFRSASPVSVVSCADAPSCRVASFFSGFTNRFIFSQIILTKPVCFLLGSFFPYLFLYINSRCIFLNLFDVLQHLLFLADSSAAPSKLTRHFWRTRKGRCQVRIASAHTFSYCRNHCQFSDVVVL